MLYRSTMSLFFSSAEPPRGLGFAGSCALLPLFDPSCSPRNFAVVGQKGGREGPHMSSPPST